MADQFTTSEFAKGLRVTYPELADIADDDQLVDSYLKVKPAMSSQIIRANSLAPPPSLPGAYSGPAAPPNPDTFRSTVSKALDYVPNPIAGAKRVAQGIKALPAVPQEYMPAGLPPPPQALSVDAATRPYADIVGGAMEAGSPLLAVGAVTATGATAAALGAGVVGTEAARYGLRKMGAPPAVEELVGDLTGLLTGGMAANAVHGKMAASAAARTAEGDAVRARLPNPTLDRLNTGVEQDATNFAAQAEESTQRAVKAGIVRQAMTAVHDEHKQSPKSPWDYLNGVTMMLGQHEELPPPPSIYDTNSEPPITGPFSEMVDSYSRVPPVLEPPPEMRALPPARPDFLVAPPEFRPESVDVTDPARAPRYAQASERYPREVRENFTRPQADLVNTIGEQVASGLENRPPTASSPPVPETAKVRLRERQTYKEAYQRELADAASQMEEMPHQRGRQFNDTRTGETYYTPPVAGADVYWRIVEESDARTKPSRRYITGILRAMSDSGAETGKALPKENLPDLMEALGVETEAGARRAYDQWKPYADKVLDRFAKRRMAYEAERGAGDAASPDVQLDGAPPQIGEPPLPDFLNELGDADTGVGPDEAGAEMLGEGAPPVAEATPALGEPPRVFDDPEARPEYNRLADHSDEELTALRAEPELQGLVDEEMQRRAGGAGGAEGEQEPPLPGMEPTRFDAPPVAELPEQGYQLQAQQPEMRQQGLLSRAFGVKELQKGTASGSQSGGSGSGSPSFFDLIKGEEGRLILNVKPGNARGLADWIARHSDEYGDELAQAREVLESGDHKTAYRLAVMAVGRINASEAVGAMAGAGQREKESTVSGIPTEKIKAAVEESLGRSLPHGTEIGEGGVLKLPKNPGHLDPKFSDVLLGKTFVTDLLGEIDPTSIVRVETPEGDLDQAFVAKHPEMRIMAQAADQIVRDMPAEVLDTYKDLLGLSTEQIGSHFIRSFSQAGRLLQMAKAWQDTYWDDILHLDPSLASTRGPGAAGRLEFLSPEKAKLIEDYLQGKRDLKDVNVDELVQTLRKIPVDQLRQIGFQLPPDIKPESAQAKSYTSRWLTTQRRMLEAGRTLEQVTADQDGISRAMMAQILGMPEASQMGKVEEGVVALAQGSLAPLVSQASTAMHVLWSQAGTYASWMVEEAITAASKGVLAGVAEMRGKGPEAARLRGEARYAGNLAKNLATGAANAKGAAPMGMLRKPWIDGLHETYQYTADTVGMLSKKDARRYLSALEEFPADAGKLVGSLFGEQFGRRAGEDLPVIKYLVHPNFRNTMTAMLRFQEGTFRTVAGDAILRTEIAAKGDIPDDVLSQPGGLVGRYGEQEASRMIGASVGGALNVTMASDPVPGTLPAWVMEIFDWQKQPALSAMVHGVVPFPRMTFTGMPRWIWDHAPGTFVLEAGLKQFRKGRVQLGEQRAALNAKIPALNSEIGSAQSAMALSMGKQVELRVELAAAAKSYKAMEARMGQAHGDNAQLPQIHDEMLAAHEGMRTRVEALQEQKAQYQDSKNSIKAKQQQLKEMYKQLRPLEGVDAPDWPHFLARQATGAGLLTMAIALRASQKEDTSYSQFRIPGTEATIDTKWAGQMAPLLLLADIIVDHQRHGWSDYNGKYSKGRVLSDAVEAVFSARPYIGASAAVIDMLRGKIEDNDLGENGQGTISKGADFILQMMGEFAGRWSTPARNLTDVVGQFYQPEATTRIPQEAGPAAGKVREVVEPFLSNIPGARERVPEKVDPFTGEAREQATPIEKPLAGLTVQIPSDMQKELNKTGTPYGKVAPHTYGDRELDNKIAKAYGMYTNKYLPVLTGNEKYQSMSPRLQQVQLEKVFAKVRRAAYGTVAREMLSAGDRAGAEALMVSPATRAKRQAMQQWLQQRVAAETKRLGPPSAEPEIAGQDQAEPQVGTPPPGGF